MYQRYSSVSTIARWLSHATTMETNCLTGVPFKFQRWAEFKCSATSETERWRMLLFSAAGKVKGKSTAYHVAVWLSCIRCNKLILKYECRWSEMWPALMAPLWKKAFEDRWMQMIGDVTSIDGTIMEESVWRQSPKSSRRIIRILVQTTSQIMLSKDSHIQFQTERTTYL